MTISQSDVSTLSRILKGIKNDKNKIIKDLLNHQKPITSFVRQKENIPGVYIFFITPKTGTVVSNFSEVWNQDIKKYSPRVVMSRFQVSTL